MRRDTLRSLSPGDALKEAEVSRREKVKNPAVAAALSLLFNGLGQAYNGQFAKGILVLLGSLFGLFIMILPGVAIWLWGAYDAYRTAKGMNEGDIPYRETGALKIVAFLVVWAVTIISLSAAAMMLLIAIGLEWML